MSLHDDTRATLSAWTPPSTSQSALRERFLGHLAAHENGMERSCTPAHITAGVLVIDEDGDRVLLNLHRKAQRWFHFGGHCEPGDSTLRAAAAREGREESGIAGLVLHEQIAQLDSHLVPFCGDHAEVEHLDVRYVARVPAATSHTASEESLAVRWWPVDGLPDLEPAMHELIAIARARFGLSSA